MPPRYIVLFLVVVVLILGGSWMGMSVAAQTNSVDCTQFYEDATPSDDGNFCEMRALPLQFINVIEPGTGGRIWIGTERQGLTLLENGTLRNWQPTAIDIRADAIRGMAANDDYVVVGMLSCGGCGGTAVYDIAQDTWTAFFPGNNLASGGVGGVAVDQNNRVYMPTDVGTLEILDNDGTWQHLAPEEATPNSPYIYFGNSSDAVFDADGNLYVGYAGLKKFDGETWLNVTSFPADGVNNIAVDSHGYLWVATPQGLIVGNDAEGWKAVPPSPSHSATEGIDDVAIDTDGRVWVIGKTTLAAFNGQTWGRVANPSENTFWGNTLAFDTAGNLWVEKDQGLAVFTGEMTLAPPTYQSLADIAGTTVTVEAASPFTSSQQPRIPTWFLAVGLIFICGGLLFIGIIVLYLVRTRPKPTSDL